MFAAYLNRHGGPECLETGTLPDPVAGPGMVVVKLTHSGLNHLDVWVRKGLPHLRLSYPHILGGDGAGKVARVGAGVTEWKVGDDVIVHPGLGCGECEKCRSGWESLCPKYGILGETTNGTNAQEIAVPAANLFAKPKSISFAQAAAVPLVFTTAWQMVVVRGRVSQGMKVLVHAAGSGVGMAALQIARLHGAEVIATAGDETKCRKALELGAHHAINYRCSDWTQQLRAIAKGGVDLTIDHLGAEHWARNLKALKWGGRIVVCGATSGPEAVTDLRQIFFRQLEVLGSTMGSKKDFPAILRHLSEGKLKVVVGAEFPLSEVRRAHEALEARSIFGKVVLKLP